MNNETLKTLVKTHGLEAVLAGLVFITNEEAEEIRDMQTPEDEATADQIEEVTSLMLQAAKKYDAILAK